MISGLSLSSSVIESIMTLNLFILTWVSSSKRSPSEEARLTLLGDFIDLFPEVKDVDATPEQIVRAIRKDKNDPIYRQIIELMKEDITEADVRFMSEEAGQPGEEGFKRFSTTLLFSRYQKHDLLKQVGEEVAREFGIEFFYHDFRPGWKRSIEICKELDIYRQKYCGCIFSEEERYNPTSPPAND